MTSEVFVKNVLRLSILTTIALGVFRLYLKIARCFMEKYPAVTLAMVGAPFAWVLWYAFT
jgi:hypothetical protein